MNLTIEQQRVKDGCPHLRRRVTNELTLPVSASISTSARWAEFGKTGRRRCQNYRFVEPGSTSGQLRVLEIRLGNVRNIDAAIRADD